MRIPTTFETVKARYPKQVAEVVANQHKGTSVHKEALPETLEWTFEWCISIRSFSLLEILMGAQQEHDEPPISKRISCCLAASKGRGCWRSSVLPEVPSEVLMLYDDDGVLK